MITIISILSVFFCILGLVFRIFKPLNVFSGISAENVTDRDGLARWVGNSLLVFALIYAALAAALHLLDVDLSNTSSVTATLIAIYLMGQGLVVSYVMGTGKYTKKTALPPRVIETEES